MTPEKPHPPTPLDVTVSSPLANYRRAAAYRAIPILGAVAIGVSAVGFVVGIRQPVRTLRSLRPAKTATVQSTVLPAPSYGELRQQSILQKSNSISHFSQLIQPKPGLFDPVVRTAAMKSEALQDRLRTRAFDGAPPTIPHPIDQQSASSCLVCHGSGAHIGGNIAPRISHAIYSNCTQCHIESKSSSLATELAGGGRGYTPVANSFAGVLRSGPGTRLLNGAPPTIPHTLQLRSDCLSCHGLAARAGLRTTHPWLQNCQQCHVAPSDLPQSHDELATKSSQGNLSNRPTIEP